MAKLRFPRLPNKWEDQPQLFERYWDITMRTLEELVTSTGIVTQINGAGTTVVTGAYPVFTITSNDQFVGTVTSVNASGGTTGLTFSGGPVTSSGVLTLGGTLGVPNGGTGETTATGTGSVVKTSGPTLDNPTVTGTLSAEEVTGDLYIPSTSGPPSGAPSLISGYVPMHYDTTNDEFYIYNGTWKKVALS